MAAVEQAVTEAVEAARGEAQLALQSAVREAVEACDNTRFDRSHLRGFGASSVDFETVYYMSVPDYAAYMDTQQAINLSLYERFADEGIEFAFPTRTIHVVRGADADASNDGDAAA